MRTLIAVALLVLVAGCGGSSDDDASSAPKTKPSDCQPASAALQEFTSWPDADESAADISSTDPSVKLVKSCL